MSNILYRPNLGIPRSYETDGEAFVDYRAEDILDESLEQDYSQLKDTADNIKNIRTIFTQLPNEISNISNTIINTLEFLFVQVDQDYIVGEKNNNNELITEDPDYKIITVDKNNSESDDDMLLYSDVVPDIVIKTMPQDRVRSINKKYCGTLLAIVVDYIDSLRSVTTQYFSDIAMLVKSHEEDGIAFVEKRYTYKTTDIKDKDLYHISDFIIRSQIIRDQKQRMMRKLINKEESLNKITACEVSRELLLRYEKENHKENHTINDMFSNMSLKESQLQYEKKMDDNLYELYKYLNSSVILLEECLMLYIKEAQAKSILIKKEGIKI